MSNEHTATPWHWECGSIYAAQPAECPFRIAGMDREPGNGLSPAERDANGRFREVQTWEP